MNRREWWLFNAGLNAMGAIVGALMHSAFLIVWNMVWLGLDFYFAGPREK